MYTCIYIYADKIHACMYHDKFIKRSGRIETAYLPMIQGVAMAFHAMVDGQAGPI